MELPYQDKNDTPWSSHALIQSRLERLPKSALVLDIGAAGGTIGRFCAQLGLRSKGVEPNPAWASAARPYYDHLAVGRIEDIKDDFIREADAVVLGDVLEHLADPETTLSRLVSLQLPACLFIISVPNVANLWIRINLLLGRFEYTERGILDRTHLRFFTRGTFLAMLDRCGLQVDGLEVTPIPLELVSPFFMTNPAGRLINGMLAKTTRYLPTLLGYQFFASARKKASTGSRYEFR